MHKIFWHCRRKFGNEYISGYRDTDLGCAVIARSTNENDANTYFTSATIDFVTGEISDEIENNWNLYTE